MNADECGDLTNDADAPPPVVCRPIRNAAGDVVATAICSPNQPFSPEMESALAEVVEAAKHLFADRDADGALSARQEQARAANRERLARLGIDRTVPPAHQHSSTNRAEDPDA